MRSGEEQTERSRRTPWWLQVGAPKLDCWTIAMRCDAMRCGEELVRRTVLCWDAYESSGFPGDDEAMRTRSGSSRGGGERWERWEVTLCRLTRKVLR
jgi:hypothetical protein